mgnify:CR=1 FL=1
MNGIHREWGARPLRRMIQNQIENEISTRFLTGEFTENGVITVKSKNKELKFTQEKKKLRKSTSRKTTPKEAKTVQD